MPGLLENFYLFSAVLTTACATTLLILFARLDPHDSKTTAAQRWLLGLIAWAFFDLVLSQTTRRFGPEAGFVVYRYLSFLFAIMPALGCDLLLALMDRASTRNRILVFGLFVFFYLLGLTQPHLISPVSYINSQGYPVQPGPWLFVFSVAAVILVSGLVTWLLLAAAREGDRLTEMARWLVAAGGLLALAGPWALNLLVLKWRPGYPLPANLLAALTSAVALYGLIRSGRVFSPRTLYETMAQVIPNGLAQILNGRITWANSNLARLLGCQKADELIGRRLEDFFDNPDRSEEIWPEELPGEGGLAVWNQEVQIKTADGRLVDCLITMTPLDRLEVPEGALLVLTDVSPIKKAQQELGRSEARYRALVEQASDLIVVFQDGVCVFASQGAEKLLGRRPSELIGQPVGSFHHPEDASEARERQRRRLSGQEVSNMYQIRLRDGNGRTKWVEASAEVVTWEGRPAVQASYRDLTERRQAEEERLRRERLEGVVEMAGAAAHELNQPLMALMGSAELAAGMIEPGHPAGSKIERIIGLAERMGRITAQIGRIVRYQTREYVAGAKIIDLREAIKTEEETPEK